MTTPARVAKFLVPDIIFGVGVLAEVGDAVRRQGGVHVFVVSDPGVVQAGWTSEVMAHIAAAGVEAELWSGLTPNPKDHEVEAGCAAYLASRCDVLVAVGGGSCIDAAKAIAVLATHGGQVAGYAGVGQVPGPLPPTVMVPIETVRAFAGKAGLPAGLHEIGVRMSQLDEISRNALGDAYIVTNPRHVREEDARAICLAAW